MSWRASFIQVIFPKSITTVFMMTVFIPYYTLQRSGWDLTEKHFIIALSSSCIMYNVHHIHWFQQTSNHQLQNYINVITALYVVKTRVKLQWRNKACMVDLCTTQLFLRLRQLCLVSTVSFTKLALTIRKGTYFLISHALVCNYGPPSQS